MKNIPILFAVCLVLLSCNDKALDLPSYEEKLIVEGWIENGHPPVVIVSTTLPISSTPRQISAIKEHILRYATVSVEVDSVTYYLTSRLSESLALRNYYTSSVLTGTTGKKYTLRVEWNDHSAWAECTIPESPSISGIKTTADTDSTFRSTLSYSNMGAESYYEAFVLERNSGFYSYEPHSAISGAASGPVIETTVHHKGLNVLLKLACSQKDAYDFWTSYEPAALMTGNLNLSYSKNICGNVNGAIGYWAGYGITVVNPLIKW